MAAIVAPQLAYQIATRIRPRAEWFVGLATLLNSDLPYLTAAATGTDPTQVIDDGASSELSFTGAMLTGYVALVQSLLAAATDDVRAAYQSAVVRPLDVILSGFPTPGASVSSDPLPTLLAQRIRPRALAIRKMNYWFGNDEVAVSPNVAALASPATDDTISENNPGASDLTFGALQTILAFQATCVSPDVNTEEVSLIVETACGYPLSL